MQTARNDLLNDMVGKKTGNYQKGARKLLSLLNSSSANVRLGNSSLNTSIGDAIDAEFKTGLGNYTGTVNTAHGQKNANNWDVLLITAHDNNIVYKYQVHTGQVLKFVVNGIAGAQNKAAPDGVQLSSIKLPTVTPPNSKQPYPVLVTDPAAAGQDVATVAEVTITQDLFDPGVGGAIVPEPALPARGALAPLHRHPDVFPRRQIVEHADILKGTRNTGANHLVGRQLGDVAAVQVRVVTLAKSTCFRASRLNHRLPVHKVVVLPAPLGPIRQVTSPARASNEMPWSASMRP